jgi:hypothetical protein
VTYRDDAAVAVASLDGNDVQVTGPNGFAQLGVLSGVDVNTNGAPLTATYRITPPGGVWDSTDNGAYALNLRAGEVSDTSGNAAAAASLGTFGVNVADPTPPPSTGATWTQTSATDFGVGTPSGTVITDTSGGELTLATFGDEFNSASVDGGWSVTPWTSTGTVTTASGAAKILGAQLKSAQVLTGTAVSGRISFAAAPYQTFGLATDLTDVAGNSWAAFSTVGTTGTLYARVNSNGSMRTVSLGARPTGFHTYSVRPTTSGFEFSIDAVLKATVPSAIPASAVLRAVVSDANGSANAPLQADWVRATASVSTGTFVSSVFDAGRTATWGGATWTANVPAGTSIRVETSSGNSATPDATWSAWAAVAGGSVSSPAGRYLRYRITLTTNAAGVAPTLQDISFDWS